MNYTKLSMYDFFFTDKQVDKELASGEYFLKPHQKKAKIQQEKKVRHDY